MGNWVKKRSMLLFSSICWFWVVAWIIHVFLFQGTCSFCKLGGTWDTCTRLGHMAQEHGRFIPADGGQVRYPKAPIVITHWIMHIVYTSRATISFSCAWEHTGWEVARKILGTARKGCFMTWVQGRLPLQILSGRCLAAALGWEPGLLGGVGFEPHLFSHSFALVCIGCHSLCPVSFSP